MRQRVAVYVCVRVSESVCVYVCVRERECVSVCVCVCMHMCVCVFMSDNVISEQTFLCVCVARF